MRRAIVVSVALALVACSTAHARPNTPDPCTAQSFAQFSAKVWKLPSWERRSPAPSTIAAQRRRLKCAGPGHRKAMRHRWRQDKAAFYAHRRHMLYRQHVTPFYGGGNWWAIPYGMVVCESGGNYSFTYGAYSILDPAWHEWGGRTAHAGEASPAEQDRVAAVGWDLYGEGAWECKADGSTSWP
jgi:hypothetical protein